MRRYKCIRCGREIYKASEYIDPLCSDCDEEISELEKRKSETLKG